VILISSGGPPGTPLTEKVGSSDLVVVASWSPSVGSITYPMSLLSAPPGVTSATFQTWAQDTSGIWRPDTPFVMAIGGPGGGCSGCTPADEVCTYANVPALVPITLSYSTAGAFCGPPPAGRFPPVVFARTVIALGFGGTAAPPPGTYVVGLG
jgi:hypothetical protein